MAVSRLEDCWRPGKAVDFPRTRRGYVFVEVHAPKRLCAGTTFAEVHIDIGERIRTPSAQAAGRS